MGGEVECGGKKYPELGNFYPCEFVMAEYNRDILPTELDDDALIGETWNSTEQYYQAMKSDDIYYRTKMKKETDGLECWKMGQTVRIRDDWDEIKVDLMFKANYAKFKQNKKLRDVLTSTKGEIFPYSTPEWTPLNKWILESLRDYFK